STYGVSCSISAYSSYDRTRPPRHAARPRQASSDPRRLSMRPFYDIITVRSTDEPCPRRLGALRLSSPRPRPLDAELDDPAFERVPGDPEQFGGLDQITGRGQRLDA